MSDPWEDDTKAKELPIPGMALPGLRDLRVQFVSLIVFDLFLGPIVYINEIQKGSTYIKKLRDLQTISEVYAGVARSDVDTLTTHEDIIAVFRIHPKSDADITHVLLISCIPGTEMDPIREIGRKALMRSGADPEKLPQELSVAIREFQSGGEKFDREEEEGTIKILNEDQIKKPLKFDLIKGLGLIDLNAKIADFNVIPQWYNGKEIEPSSVLQFLDRQYDNVGSDSVTSFLFKSIPLLLIKVPDKKVYLIVIVGFIDIQKILKIGEWLNVCSTILSKEWRYANIKEIMNTINILNQADQWNSPPEFLKNYIQMAIKSEVIRPTVIDESIVKGDYPSYIPKKLWKEIINQDGNRTIQDLTENNGDDIFKIIRVLEWFRVRNLIVYLQN